MTNWFRSLVNRRIGCALAICLAGQGSFAQDNAELALARQVLTDIQMRSINENVEYCGYIGFDAAGELIATRPTRGEKASCLADEPVDIGLITASYHTHGAFSPDYYNEVPSADDIEGDELEGVDGYVATPGGRLWYVDTNDMVVSQICGLGCLPADANFIAGNMGVIAPSYAYRDLVKLLE